MAKCRECGKSNPFLKLDPSGICRECYLADLKSTTDLKGELEDQVRKLKIDLHDIKVQIAQAKKELETVKAERSLPEKPCQPPQPEPEKPQQPAKPEPEKPRYYIAYDQSGNPFAVPIVKEAAVPVRAAAPAPAPEKKAKQEDLFLQALKIVVENDDPGVSILIEELNIDFDQAARLLKQMEQKAYVTPAEGYKPRTVLVLYDEVAPLFED